MATEEKEYDMLTDIKVCLTRILEQSKKIEAESLFSGEADYSDCFLDINAGAGGTESNDWAEMLLRMYLRFTERLELKSEIVHVSYAEEAGIKSVTVKVSGHNSYGWLRTEAGVHRLVRNSPFNSLNKRMTSFASVSICPKVDDGISIDISEKDLRIDTYRASGAGGQHVNTTDSAVRIKHTPTGITVQCQNNKSQHRNKDECLKMLKSRLYELEIQNRLAKTEKANSNRLEIGWGSQIRSYVLQPYQLVKDLRTGTEVGNIKDVLDGNLTSFIYASLSKKKT
jgi:peptide chain release factor 2